jgi:hypothetical protein
MIALQCFDKWSTLGLLDHPTGSLREALKSEIPELSAVRTRGHYSRLGGQVISVFRTDGILYIASDQALIPFDDKVTIEFDRGPTRVLRVSRDKEAEIDIRYRLQDVDNLVLTVDPFTHEEDFDFGLFLYKLYLDKPRRERIYTEECDQR